MSKKPPLGLVPRNVHEQNRIFVIEKAIVRYVIAGMPIPVEWVEELVELYKRTEISYE